MFMTARQFRCSINHCPSPLRNLHSYKHVHQLLDESPCSNPTSLYPVNVPFDAFKRFKLLLKSGLVNAIDEVTLALALKGSCGNSKQGTQVHKFAVTSGLMSFVTVPNSLMNMYCKSGQFERALCVFEGLNDPDIVSWNTLLSGFQRSEEALTFVLRMNMNGVAFDAVTCTTTLSFCLDIEGFILGLQMHALVMKSGLDSEVFVGNALITMYARWKRLEQARRIFDEMANKDLVSWNAILSGYSQEDGYGLKAIWTFNEMVKQRMKLDNVSFTGAVSACGHERNLEVGRQVHGVCIKRGYGTHVSVCNVLMSMYAKCEVVEDAKLVFRRMNERNVISWTTMISIDEKDALHHFNEMRSDYVYPNDVTFVGLIHAITTGKLVEEGRMVHACCVKGNFLSESNVCNSLITMYAKFELIQDSVKVFEELESREIVSWNALISGYAQNGMFLEALRTFFSAARECKPNQYTFGSVLNAIGSGEHLSLKHGQWCHLHLIKVGLNTDPIVSNALLDMYAKRGSMSEAQKVFSEIPQKSEFAWTSLISAHARHGNYDSVMASFREMKREGVKPDSVTFLSILTACGRNGMVDIGKQLFDSMLTEYQIEPSSEHYSCMVDMLGRAGRLEEAEKLMGCTPGGPGLSMLQSLLGACTIHGNVDMGERVADTLMQMEPNESGPYVLMSNLYAEKGKWEKVAKLRKMMRQRGVRKEVGFSWVDVGAFNNSMSLHGFSSGLSMLQSLLGACTIHGNVDMGERVADTLMQMEPNESGPYVLMSNLYAEKGKWEKVAKLRKMMRQRGVRKEVGFSWVDVGAFNNSMSLHGFSSGLSMLQSLLGACTIHGNVDMGERVADTLMQMEPNESGPYVLMSNLYAEKGKWEKVAKLRKMMRQRGVRKEVGFSWVDVGAFNNSMSLHGFSSGLSMLQSLLGACTIHGNVDMGERVADTLMQMEPNESGPYVLMSNLYAEKGKWEKVAKLRKMMRQRGVRKEVGFSWVDVGAFNNSMSLHGFSSGDRSHPQSDEICKMAECLGLHMKLLREKNRLRIHGNASDSNS